MARRLGGGGPGGGGGGGGAQGYRPCNLVAGSVWKVVHLGPICLIISTAVYTVCTRRARCAIRGFWRIAFTGAFRIRKSANRFGIQMGTHSPLKYQPPPPPSHRWY